ncbi:MAG TPA: hypothetical protein VGJ94_03805 [Syntrophorhabdaceae bacterium]|jgi:hypothetical protein
MKKVFLFGLALLISLAFVSHGLAQDKAKAPAADKAAAAPDKAVAPASEKALAPADKAPAPEKAKPKVKAKKAKAKAKARAGFVGTVTNYDSVSKIATVKGKGAAVGFDLSNARLKGYTSANDIKAGDKVVLRYEKDGIKVEKIGGKKADKASKAGKTKKSMKKAKAKKKAAK